LRDDIATSLDIVLDDAFLKRVISYLLLTP